MTKVLVDSQTCMKCGLCASMFEDNFEIDEETGTSKVKSQENFKMEMAEVCPVGAIKVIEEDEEPQENE